MKAQRDALMAALGEAPYGGTLQSRSSSPTTSPARRWARA
jgi:hypothetical protein